MSQQINVKWDWADTKVHPAIRYPSSWIEGGNASGSEKIIAMVDSFNPRINTPKDVINSLNDYGQGMTSKPPEYFIDITCKPFGDGYSALLGCQNGDRFFDIVLAPLADYGITDQSEVGQPSGAWAPELVVFEGCKVLSSNERYSYGNVPTVTFSCRSLRYAWGEGQNQVRVGNGLLGRTTSSTDLGL